MHNIYYYATAPSTTTTTTTTTTSLQVQDVTIKDKLMGAR